MARDITWTLQYNSREIAEGLQVQGADEKLIYTLTTTNWASTPASPAFAIYSYSGDTLTDCTTGCSSGSVSAANDVITLPKIVSLTAGTKYRVEVQFTVSNNVYEAYDFEPRDSHILLSERERLRATRMGIAMPSVLGWNRVYDNGDVYLYHRRPRTPYQR